MTEALPMLNCRFEPLTWDTQHYGMGIGRITGAVCSATQLEALLNEAIDSGARLIYYYHSASFLIDETLLARFGGRRVGGHVRYTRMLDRTVLGLESASGLGLEVYDGPSDCSRMRSLAINAGRLSRFRTDTRLSASKCDELYSLWIERSIRGELADEVLVARIRENLCGLVTFRCKPPFCEIGLVSTAVEARGRGVGSALLNFAHQRMFERGILRSEVVTQPENIDACRLYEKAGYTERQRGDYYHFLVDQQ